MAHSVSPLAPVAAPRLPAIAGVELVAGCMYTAWLLAGLHTSAVNTAGSRPIVASWRTRLMAPSSAASVA